MAIAGKVAITLSTENGGAWSADVTYDRLVAVKHNNNLYISRKTVANVEPPNDEFWFLSLEGFGGDDVQTLIDRLNELSDFTQTIIDGTTQVGNAKTLDGNSADVFAKANDLSNYFPKSGGTIEATGAQPLKLKNTTGTLCFISFIGNGGNLGYFGFSGANNAQLLDSNGTLLGNIYHTGNKPTGTYVGDGTTTTRKIATGGIGNWIAITNNSNASEVFISVNGGFGKKHDGTNASTVGLVNSCGFSNGNLQFGTDDYSINASGVTYTWQVL